MKTRADRIRDRLRALQLSEAAASKKAGLNIRFVTDLLDSPDHSPRAANLRKLAEALETTADWLEHGIEPHPQNLDRTSAELLSILPKLDERARRRLLENAKVEIRLSKDE